MKKIFVALVLALALCLSMVGCGEEKSGADYVIEAFGNIGESFEAAQVTENTRITLSVADVTSLCTMLGVNDGSLPTLKDAFMDVYGGTNYGMANLGVTLGDKALNLAAVCDTEKLIFSSEQLSQNYGSTVEEFCTLLEKLIGEELPYNYEDILKYSDPAVMEAMDARYSEKIETLIRENFEFTTEKDGKNVLVSCTLTPENISTIAYEFLTYLQADTELLDMIGTLYGEEFVNEIGALEVNKDEMLSSLNETGISGTVKFTIVKKTSELLAVDAALTANEESGTVQYAKNETGFTASVKDTDTVLEILSTSGDDTYALTVKATESGEETLNFELQVAEDITLSVTVDGTTVGATVDYTTTENGFEATLTKVDVAGIGLDLSSIGIKLAAETGVELPAMPEEYTSIADYTEQQFQTILLEFIMNSGLLAYMQ